MNREPLRILCWVQNLLGSGHLKRQLTIGRAAVRAGCRFAIVNGGFPQTFPVPKGIEWYQLPPLRAFDASFATLVDPADNPVDEEYWELRQSVLRDVTDQFRPHVVLTEMFPFGRRKFKSEVTAWLAWLDRSVQRVASVRDVLVTPKKPERAAEYCDLVRQHYDHVLVHSDPGVQPFDLNFAHTNAIVTKLHYTGYVSEPIAPPPAKKSWAVVISVGSGIVGRRLIDAALNCHRDGMLDHKPWLIVAGKQANEDDVLRWKRLGGNSVRLERFITDLPDQIAASELSVSQAGYNTVAETLNAGTPMLLVPFQTPTEDEQLKRAQTLERLGRAVVLTEDRLNEENLTRSMTKARNLHPLSSYADLSGAEKSVHILKQLACGQTR